MDEKMSPRRASEWLVALTEAPEDADLRERLADWIAASPDHARDWREMTHTYEVMGMTMPVLQADWGAFAASRDKGEGTGALDRAMTVTPRRRTVRGGLFRHVARAPKRSLAAAAIAAGLLLVFAPEVQLRLRADHVTATAEVRSLRLDDGSIVRLGPQSAVAVDYRSSVRNVRLLKGEAFFEVAPNPARPFRVAANHATTTVLGTAFDVRLRDEGVDVGVGHGHVRVDYAAVDPRVSEDLRAGERLRLGWDGHVARGRSPADQIGAWRNGMLVAKDAGVADVIDAIRPWYGGMIMLRGERLARQPTTGVYRLADPVAAVQALADSQGAHVRRITPWLLVVSAP